MKAGSRSSRPLGDVDGDRHLLQPQPAVVLAVQLRPGGFLDLGDQLLKGGPWPVFVIGQVDGGLSQAGEVRCLKVLRCVGGEDLKGEILSQDSDQFGFGCHGTS